MTNTEFQLRRPSTKHVPDLELWGGVECTLNRIGDRYMDQLALNGHADRLSDFELIKGLGVSSLRHSVLWERVAPHGLDAADWTWADTSLSRIREVGLRPIVGLVHHGSGPISTNLLDPEIGSQLAVYATAVAQRYPWVEDYTPINEPLTTARFSALYGHWYPHRKDDLSFCRALLNECRAVILAMRAIRAVNPSARLVQTEDLGKTFSTPKLLYQAEFENERRWCSFDLLLGLLNREHPLWSYFTTTGIEPDELKWFLDNPCPPNLIGLNHYLSGERFLDEHLHRYPARTHGGNGRHYYADVVAGRVRREGASGPAALMLEAWHRYQLPLAITECHNGCTREEQLRWFADVWNAAHEARRRGADVAAVTAWSLFGAFNWSSLVTSENSGYESGLFDLRSPRPRPTALVKLARTLSSGGRAEHPLLQQAGWWKSPRRFVYGFSVDQNGRSETVSTASSISGVRPLLILGARGTLGRAFANVCGERGIAYRLLSRAACDIADAGSVQRAFQLHNPWAVINAAGYVRVEEAERDRERCFRDNTQGAATLAAECAVRGVQLVTFSSDLVFDGIKATPYLESDRPAPINHYGFTKAEAERLVQNILPSALIIRCSAFFGPWDNFNFVSAALQALTARRPFKAATDVLVSPTYVPDLANTTLDLLIDEEQGLWHLANAGETSWYNFAQKAAVMSNVDPQTLIPVEAKELGLRANMPLFSVLGSERSWIMPSLEDALVRFAASAQQAVEAQLSAA